MKKTLLIFALACATLTFAQDPASSATTKEVETAQDSGIVTISSKGQDVRNVLFDLFAQSKKSFVLEPNAHFVLYLALTGVQFDEALEIVCHTASLKYELNNGIYYVSRTEKPEPVRPKPETAPKPLGKLSTADLMKKVTTRMSKADIRSVFTELQSQSGVTIEVDKSVPSYKVDAFLVGTSLKYALDVMTKAAGLEYLRTDNRTLLVQVKPKS